MTTSTRSRGARSSRQRRRLSGFLALVFALVAAGGLYTLLAPRPQVAQAADGPALVRQGQQIYQNTCITCHGSNLQGVTGRGPSLIGVGDAAVYFQVSTGRMPLASQGQEAPRRPAQFNSEQIDALGAFVEANGGGPVAPQASGAALRGNDTARGGELFRLNCASCHNFTGRGGALSSGKQAPNLDPATEKEIYTAMLSGPGNMPKFADSQLSPDEKKDIIAYVKSVTNGKNNPGGNPLGGYGPVPEGFIAWVVGLAAIIAITLWIGAKA